MSEQREGDGEPTVKVVDRRRFRQGGEPVPDEGGEASREKRPEALPAEPTLSEAEQRIAAQEARIDELSRAYAALVEDNKAFRARLEREKERVIQAERADVAQALLDAADELERALAAVSGSGDLPATLVDGVRLTLAGLTKRISGLGATRLEVVGQPFDPRVSEAVDTVTVADTAQDGMVVEEVRAGYRIGERILRPARVRVGRLAQA